MSRTYHHGERRIRVRGVRRKPTDLRRLARALIELEYQQAQSETEAEAEHKQRNNKRRGSTGKGKPASRAERKDAA